MNLKVQDIYHTSSFPSILDSYLSSKGLETAVSVAQVATQLKQIKVRRDRKTVFHHGSAVSSDQVEKLKHKALLDQRHLQSYNRIHRLKETLSQHYSKLLEEKVQKQRLEKKQEDSSNVKTTKTRRLNTQKLTRSILHHDQAYLRSLPKTRHYLILELQRRLAQHGCFGGPKDQEVFTHWVGQQKAAELEKRLQEIVLCSKSAPELKLDDLLNKKPKNLTHISSEGNHGQQEPQVRESRGEDGMVSMGTPYSKEPQEQDGCELRFPRVFSKELLVPRFSTLQPDFLETLRTNIPHLRVKKPHCKLTAATVTPYKLHLMHTISLTHMDYSRSLLERNRLSMRYDTEHSIKDLMWNVHLDSVSAKEQPPPPQPLRQHTTPDNSHTEERNASADQMTRLQSSQCRTSRANNISTEDVPLSMEDLSSHSISLFQVKVSGDKMWTNYA